MHFHFGLSLLRETSAPNTQQSGPMLFSQPPFLLGSHRKRSAARKNEEEPSGALIFGEPPPRAGQNEHLPAALWEGTRCGWGQAPEPAGVFRPVV